MPSREQPVYLLNTRTVCVIFLYNWKQCIDGFSLLLQRYDKKVTMQKEPNICKLLFVTENTFFR